MTVAAADAKAGPYTGNGVATTFAFAFKIFATSDIRVIETVIATGVETDLILNGANGYTVVKNNDQDNNPGGTITYRQANANAPLPSTKKLTIVGNFAYSQPTDLPNGGPFFANVVENALDRLTMLVKQLREGFNRSLRLSVSDPAGSATEIPPISVRANNLLGFDANGNPIAVAPAAQSATALQALLATTAGAGMVGADDGAGGSLFTNLAGFISKMASSAGASIVRVAQSGAGATARTVEDEIRETIKASQFGMNAGASAAVNTAALQAAISRAVAVGNAQVEIVAGNYAMTAGANFAADDVAIVGCGKVVLDYSAGAGIGFKIDAGGMGALVKRMRVENIHVKGGPAITEAFYSRGVVRSIFRNIEVKEATTNGFAIRFGVLNTYDHCIISDDTGVMTTRPTSYWYLDDDGAVGNHTQANVFLNCEASGQGAGSTKTGWTLVNAILNCWFGGTGESMGIGVDITNDVCRLNLFEGFDVEDNQTYDIRVKGVANTFNNCLFQSPSVVDNVSISTGVNTRFTGCYIRKANLGIGSSDTDFETCYFDDAVGNGIQGVGSYKLYNCITNTGGVGGPKTGTMRDVLGPTVAATLEISQGNTPAQIVDKNEAALAGQQINMRGRITANAAGTAANSIAVSLDAGFPAKTSAVGLPCGNFMLVTAGGTIYTGVAVLNSSSVLVFRTNAATGNLGINPAVTLAAGDILSFSVSYPLA